MTIRYTSHAQSKFELLARYGFPVTHEQVADILTSPDKTEPDVEDRFIAQKRVTERHVLRVVYRREGEDYVVITFYPGRRKQYESKV